MTDSGNESDTELLDLLVDDNEVSENATPESSAPSKLTDFNFLDEKSQPSPIKNAPKKDSPIKYKDHSSDEEDIDYYNRKQLSDYGRDLKDIMKQEKKDKEQKVFTEPSRTQNESIHKPKASQQPSTSSLATKTTKTEFKGIYNDPVFGLGIKNPLVSSTELVERMRGRKAVTISNLKSHVTSQDVKDDWVVAGVLVSKSNSFVSSKGSQYYIWKLSDLSASMNLASLFLFGNSHKNLWKTTVGTVIGVLNPNVMENRESKDNTIATLSVENPAKLMIIGTSRDMGRCQSKKRNGDPCNAIINIRQCKYCVYHVQKEYKSFSRRPEIVSNVKGMQPMGFGVKRNPPKSQSSMMNGMQQQIVTVKSKKSEKTIMKDQHFLKMLQGNYVPKVKEEPTNLKPKLQRVELFPNQTKKDLARLEKLRSQEAIENNGDAVSVQSSSSPKFREEPTNSKPKPQREELFPNQTKKDLSRLEKLKNEVQTNGNSKPKLHCVDKSPNQPKKVLSRLEKIRNQASVKTNENAFSIQSLFSSSPKVKVEPKDPSKLEKLKSQEPVKKNGNAFSLQSLSYSQDLIDLSVPISKKKIDAAKRKALEYIQKKGGIKAANPNKIHPNKEKTLENNKKRKLEENEETVKEKEEKKARFSSEFQKLLEIKSNHTDLIEKSKNEDQEKYFDKLEVKEKMEEKMISTYMVDCKAVTCAICKYKAFSASDMCKERQHPIRVIDAVKRFFKCGDCGNRTVCLDRIPVKTCSRCSSSNWLKTGMMDEKRLEVKKPELSIRGDEEKFYGSSISGANLNLIVPD